MALLDAELMAAQTSLNEAQDAREEARRAAAGSAIEAQRAAGREKRADAEALTLRHEVQVLRGALGQLEGALLQAGTGAGTGAEGSSANEAILAERLGAAEAALRANCVEMDRLERALAEAGRAAVVAEEEATQRSMVHEQEIQEMQEQGMQRGARSTCQVEEMPRGAPDPAYDEEAQAVAERAAEVQRAAIRAAKADEEAAALRRERALAMKECERLKAALGEAEELQMAIREQEGGAVEVGCSLH